MTDPCSSVDRRPRPVGCEQAPARWPAVLPLVPVAHLGLLERFIVACLGTRLTGRWRLRRSDQLRRRCSSSLHGWRLASIFSSPRMTPARFAPSVFLAARELHTGPEIERPGSGRNRRSPTHFPFRQAPLLRHDDQSPGFVPGWLGVHDHGSPVRRSKGSARIGRLLGAANTAGPSNGGRDTSFPEAINR